MKIQEVFPFLKWKSHITPENLKKDFLAGLIGAMIVLPQAVAFATIAGLPPEYGLYAAIVPTIIAGLWGSSFHLVSGPTTAISLVVFTAISPLAEPKSVDYVQLVLTLSFLVGIIQLLMGWFKFGSVLNFISHTVVIAFTSGAAVLIFANQIKNFFGIAIPQGLSFVEMIKIFIDKIGEINPYVTSIAITTLIVGILIKSFFKKIPYMIPAMLVGSLFGFYLNKKFGVDVTKIKVVGILPSTLPPLSHPSFDLKTIGELIKPAVTVTFLALIEAIAIARSIAFKSGQKLNSNQEFIGQGLANIFGSFFSAYPSSGSFNRSGVNYEAGAKTPLAVIFASVFLSIIVLFVGPLAKYLPNAVMAGVLFLVAYGLIDFHHIKEIFKTSKSEAFLFSVTFLSALFIELDFAIFIGVLISLAFYLKQTSQPAVLSYIPNSNHPRRKFGSVEEVASCPQLSIVYVDGSLYFGSVAFVDEQFDKLEEQNPVAKNWLIIGSGINFVDLAGADLLLNKVLYWKKRGGNVFFCGLSKSVFASLEKKKYVDKIGKENFFHSKTEAIHHIYTEVLNKDICQNCEARIFLECGEK